MWDAENCGVFVVLDTSRAVALFSILSLITVVSCGACMRRTRSCESSRKRSWSCSLGAAEVLPLSIDPDLGHDLGLVFDLDVNSD